MQLLFSYAINKEKGGAPYVCFSLQNPYHGLLVIDHHSLLGRLVEVQFSFLNLNPVLMEFF